MGTASAHNFENSVLSVGTAAILFLKNGWQNWNWVEYHGIT